MSRSSCGVVLMISGFLLACASVPVWATHSIAPSQFVAPDARALGMGSAFTAVAEGASAAWWNPGALGLMEGVWITPYSFRQTDVYVEGTDIRAYGLAAGHRGYGIGLSLNRFDYPDHVAKESDSRDPDHYDHTTQIAAGVDVARFGRASPSPFRLGLGAALRRVDVSAATSSCTIDDGATGVDLGALASLRLRTAPEWGEPSTDRILRSCELRGGLVLGNLLESPLDPSCQLGTPATLARNLRAGLAGDLSLFPVARVPMISPVLHLLVAADLFQNLTLSEEETEWHGGLEMTLLNLATWRMGYVDSMADGVHAPTYGCSSGLTVYRRGGAIRRVGARLDYADLPAPGDLDREHQYTVTLWAAF